MFTVDNVKWGCKWSRMFSYLFILNCLDFSRLDSWQIVSSRVLIFDFSTKTMSGRQDGWKIATTRFHSIDGKSTYSSWPSDFTDRSQVAMRRSTLLWRRVYLSRLVGAEHLARTCLFDWIRLHKQHSGLAIFFHLNRLEAVGSVVVWALSGRMWTDAVVKNPERQTRIQ